MFPSEDCLFNKLCTEQLKGPLPTFDIRAIVLSGSDLCCLKGFLAGDCLVYSVFFSTKVY